MGDSNSKLDKFFSFLSSVLLKIELTIAITAFTLMLVDVLAGIVMRKFLEIAFPWGEEAARYLIITGILAGLGVCAKEQAHLAVDLFKNMLPRVPRKVVEWFSELCTVGCYIFLVVMSAAFIQKNSVLGQRSASLGIPIYYIYYVLLLGFSLALLEEIYVIYKRCRKPAQHTEKEAEQ